MPHCGDQYREVKNDGKGRIARFCAIYVIKTSPSPPPLASGLLCSPFTLTVVSAANGVIAADSVTFLWVYTYPLSVYPPLILPSILAFIITTVETIGDVSTTIEVSKLPVESPESFEVRVLFIVCMCVVCVRARTGGIVTLDSIT